MLTRAAPDRPCKAGHLAWKLNAQGNFVCTECKNDRARARYASASERAAAQAPIAKPRARLGASKAGAAPAAPGSFLAVAREHLAKRDELSPATREKKAWLLEQLTALHARPMAEVTTPEIAAALQRIETCGDRRETAHRCGMLIGEITAYAAVLGLAPTNALPAGTLAKARVLKPVNTESHRAITDPRPGDTHESAPRRFGELLRAIDDSWMCLSDDSARAYLRLAPLLFVRPSELREMEWREVSIERAEWVIPPERIKTRNLRKQPHVVPLSKQALAIFREQHMRTGTGRFVFAGSDKDGLVSTTAIADGLKATLSMMHEAVNAHVPHGFRAAASTLLKGELGVDSELVERQMNHVAKDRVAGIYDRSQRLPERAAMMQQWADYLDGLRADAMKPR